MPGRRSRSRSYYSLTSDHFVDSKTKQLLFGEVEVCTMGRTILKNNEDFSNETVKELLEKQYKKRKSHGRIYCLVDRIRFQKKKSTGWSSYRNELTYREIQKFYDHRSRPDCFTLLVQEEESRRRSYESFKCKKVEDVSLLKKIIEKAHQDHQSLLKEKINDEKSHFQPLNSYETSIKRIPSSVNFGPNFENSQRTINLYTNDAHSMRNGRSLSPVYGGKVYRSSSPEEEFVIQRRSRPVSTEKVYEQPYSKNYLNTSSPLLFENVTYIRADQKNGTRVTDNGPIFMYSIRKSAHNIPNSNVELNKNLNNRRSYYT